MQCCLKTRAFPPSILLLLTVKRCSLCNKSLFIWARPQWPRFHHALFLSLVFFDAVAQLPNTALAEARVAAWVFSPVSPLRCRALRLETGEGVVPLLASAYSCIFYSNVRGSGPCCACFALFTALGIPRAALSPADIACAPWRFHFLFQAPFLKLRTLLGRKRVAFFLCWGSQISYSVLQVVHKLTLNFSNVLAFQSGLGSKSEDNMLSL